jgi:hypothetical protein
MSLRLNGFKNILHEQEVGNLGGVVDLQIPISATFLTMVRAKYGSDVPNSIGEFVVDVTHESKKKGQRIEDYFLNKKAFKQYQSVDRFLFVVLTHPSWTEADLDLITKEMNRRNAPFAENVRFILKDDFLDMIRVQDRIRSKIDQVYDIVADCLQKRDPKLREESLIKLKDIYDQAKIFLSLPLSQLRLMPFKGSFFNID